VSTVHLRVAGELVTSDSHGCGHVCGTAFEETTTATSENSIACEDTPVDRACDLVALGHFISLVLHVLVHTLARLKHVEHVSSSVAWRVQTAHLDIVGLEDLLVLHTLRCSWYVILSSTQDLDIREHLLHFLISLRVIVMLVSCQNMRRCDRHTHLVEELAHFLRFSDIYQDSWLRGQVPRDIVAEIPHISQHMNHIDLHFFNFVVVALRSKISIYLLTC